MMVLLNIQLIVEWIMFVIELFVHNDWPLWSFSYIYIQYLGTDLEEISGRTILEDDTEIELPLVTLPGTILVPGHIIPLYSHNQHEVAMLKTVVDSSQKTFGVVALRFVVKFMKFSVFFCIKITCYLSDKVYQTFWPLQALIHMVMPSDF